MQPKICSNNFFLYILRFVIANITHHPKNVCSRRERHSLTDYKKERCYRCWCLARSRSRSRNCKVFEAVAVDAGMCCTVLQYVVGTSSCVAVAATTCMVAHRASDLATLLPPPPLPFNGTAGATGWRFMMGEDEKKRATENRVAAQPREMMMR